MNIGFVLPESVSVAVDNGMNVVRAVREAFGYSVEDLAVTCGLTPEEIGTMEEDASPDMSQLTRVAHALGLKPVQPISQ
ncbi:helix-turn-helix transcriptional regulator [Mesorhizobium sp. SB112]|jgi:transcriptional regulator with XRE-family HTH domain|uniref:helix-turn-helix domain-containing protein n=1 Tax=Mesorhizobium sp. SB112 TaxID=3151853 RepID=UPI0032668E68